jgi:plastocyanin
MVDVISKTCIHEGCKKQPTFNVEGETKALFCSIHKKEGMVNVRSKTCIHEGCKKQPTFNVEGETKALFCSIHKKEDMVDVISKTCIHEGCKKQPTFNVEGETKALFCSIHKKEGMVNVKHKTCIHEGCKKQPTFNVEGETKALFCSIHKKEDMVNVISKTCIHEGCKKQPTFNVEGETKALFCSIHKKEGMEDVIHKTCKSEWCSTIVKERYDGYCLYCYMHLFPDKPVSRNYKTKEYAVVEYIKTKFPTLNWIADKIINGGCSKRRPDLLLDLFYQIVIVEIDENQHIDYDCSCENRRIMDLSQDLGHRPIIFIRFNPDDYEKNGIVITSCWGQNKKGICVVKKSKKDEWTQRLNVLEYHINYWIKPENKTNKIIEIIQLFYDA